MYTVSGACGGLLLSVIELLQLVGNMVHGYHTASGKLARGAARASTKCVLQAIPYLCVQVPWLEMAGERSYEPLKLFAQVPA